MKPQHLSDEAVAAFADGVLGAHARARAARHTAECPECAYAVATQREAVWALRAAPAPALPSGLLDRLREVPETTPLSLPPTSFGPDGSSLIATFGSLTPSGVAAAAPAPSSHSAHSHRMRPIVGAAVAVAAAGVLAVSSAAHASSTEGTGTSHPATSGARAHVQPAVYAPPGGHR